MSITKKYFGKTSEGVAVDIYILSNSNGMTVEISNYGGTIVSLCVSDGKGKTDDVTLGFDNLDDYIRKGPCFGAIVGRHANRIENAKFELNGVEYQLNKNYGEHNLHGGLKGFDKVVWIAEVINRDGVKCLQLDYKSMDGEENYPGNLDVRVIYTLTDDNALRIDYFAVSDKDTVVNLTNHAYFNLSGHSSGNILKHELMIDADKFTVINNECMPTGEIRDVKGTPMDFTKLTPIWPGIFSDDEQIAYGKGYDHNWVLNISDKKLRKVVELFDPDSGRLMEVFTTTPGIQFYSGNFLNGSDVGKGGAVYSKSAGLCLETQYFPNSLKHKNFPSPIIKVGEQYNQTTIYKFIVNSS